MNISCVLVIRALSTWPSGLKNVGMRTLEQNLWILLFEGASFLAILQNVGAHFLLQHENKKVVLLPLISLLA
jgi:hypothetical protein